jgi:hypothetical protein
MKTKNFPAKKLRRQLIANGVDLESPDAQRQLAIARSVRTKKARNEK